MKAPARGFVARAAARPAARPAARAVVLVAGLAVVLTAACGTPDGAPGRDDRDAGSPPPAVPAPTPPAPTVGMDSALLEGALDRAATLPRLRTLIVARHGETQAERHFRGPALDAPANVKSVSKSVLSALVGIAIEEGHLEGVDQHVAPFFDRYLAPDDDPRKRAITVGHLLSMQSGLERTSGANYGRWVASGNWVRYAITRPMVDEPGGTRLYSTGNTHLLSAILTQATGRSTLAFGRQYLAEPLGIRLPPWLADPQGIYFGGNEMRLTPRAMVRFGELYRNGGRQDGRQIVPEAWVRQSLQPRASSRWTGDGYGYGWFLTRVRGHDMFYAWGYGGQFIFVIPALELTVVTTSDPDVAREREHTREVRRLLAEWIVPAAEAGGSHADDHTRTTYHLPLLTHPAIGPSQRATPDGGGRRKPGGAGRGRPARRVRGAPPHPGSSPCSDG
jgi:CubicO group peptidase (beta-lactamase class C family)